MIKLLGKSEGGIKTTRYKCLSKDENPSKLTSDKYILEVQEGK